MNKYLSTLAISFSLLSISCSQDDMNTTSELDDTINSKMESSLLTIPAALKKSRVSFTPNENNSCNRVTISSISTMGSIEVMDIKIANRSDYRIKVTGNIYDQDASLFSEESTSFSNSRKRRRLFTKRKPISISRSVNGVEEVLVISPTDMECTTDGTYNIRVHNKYIKGENKVILAKW